MNKEIDEIIEQIRISINCKKQPINMDYYISITDMKKLLDYITNLQDENALLINTIRKSRDLFYEKCRISRDGIFTFNVADYFELDTILRGEDNE